MQKIDNFSILLSDNFISITTLPLLMDKQNKISEDVLHFFWKSKTLSQSSLFGYSGEEIEILNFGIHNHNEGPDFLECRVKINNTIWVGSVEIHVKSSDWINHNHSSNPKYNNVILHVVYEVDYIPNLIPCLELKKQFATNILSKLTYPNISNDPILCKPWVTNLAASHWVKWFDTLLAERFAQKSKKVYEVLSDCNNDWSECIYRYFAQSFGLKINETAFYELACRLPYKILMKHKDQLFQMEALLYGQSGLLFDPNISFDRQDTHYIKSLRDEYLFLAQKYSLTPIKATHWNFSRLRPPSFPTIRISQFASLLHHSTNLLDFVLTFDYSLFKSLDIAASPYWDNHYTFGVKTKGNIKNLGQNHLKLIVINAVVPLLYSYGKWISKQSLCETSIKILTYIPRENSSILNNWKFLDKLLKTSYETQALYHLTTNYCTKKKCLQCNIGCKVFNTDTLNL